MRYFIGFLITVGLIILLIILLVGGGGKSKVPQTHKTLPSYATSDAVARLTIDGPINAAQSHEQVQITVGRDEVVYDQFKGYDGAVVKQQTYDSTQNAYSNFLYALSHAGFTLGTKNTAQTGDERGQCPLGSRYVFELQQDGQDVERFWATSCGKPKTYEGNLSLTLQLFKDQVPDYSQLTQNLHLSGGSAL
jgi:hypothetical protein